MVFQFRTKYKLIYLICIILLVLSNCADENTSELGPILFKEKPAAPTGLEASDGLYTDKIKLTWVTIPYTDQYFIYRTRSTNEQYKKIGTSSTTSYEDIEIQYGLYYYKIKSHSSQKESSYSYEDHGNIKEVYEYITEWGGYGTGPGEFRTPAGIAVNSLGEINVIDKDNDRIQKFSNNFTQPTNYISQWNGDVTGIGKFGTPLNLTFDTDDTVYIIDGGTVRVYDSSNKFLYTWGGFKTPKGIMIDENFVYVEEKNGITKMTKLGTKLEYRLALTNVIGPEYKYFTNIHNIAIDNEGNVFQAYEDEHKIVKYTKEKIKLAEWGTPGTGEGQFYFPTHIAIDHQDYIYVSDKGNHRVQVFKRR